MRFLFLTLVTFAVGGAMVYFFLQQQQNVQVEVNNAQNSAQEKADAYKKNQADMMKQLGQ